MTHYKKHWMQLLASRLSQGKRTGDVWVTFIGISGDMLPDRQTFLIGSVFDQCSEWAV
jgi:hypothetical protein